MPAEFIEYQLVRELNWSYADVSATPIEVRDYFWRCILMEREVAAERARHAQRESEREPGAIRVAR